MDESPMTTGSPSSQRDMLEFQGHSPQISRKSFNSMGNPPTKNLYNANYLLLDGIPPYNSAQIVENGPKARIYRELFQLNSKIQLIYAY